MNPGRGWLLLTNDDGIEAVGFELLVKALHRAVPPCSVGAVGESFSDRYAHQPDETHGVPRSRGLGLRLGTRPACPLPCIFLSWTGPRVTP